VKVEVKAEYVGYREERERKEIKRRKNKKSRIRNEITTMNKIISIRN
jgi:hypothetical protein